MIELKLRVAKPEDGPLILEWLKANHQNEWNPSFLSKPGITYLCSYNDDGPVAFIPLAEVMMFEGDQPKRVLMLESFAPKPGISRLIKAQALRDFTKSALLLGSIRGISAVYFLDGAGGVDAFAENNHYHCLGKPVDGKFVPYKVFRIDV